MFSGLLWGGGAMLGSGGSGIRVAGGGFAGRQQASGVAERKFHGGDDVGERCTENGVAPKRRQLVGWPVPAENTQRAAMPGAGRQWAVHWQRRPSAGPAQAQRRPGTGQAARCVVRLRQATPTLRCHCTAAGAPPSNIAAAAAAAADLMCIWTLQRRLPVLPATGLPSAHCSPSAQRQRQWWAVPCHGALRCLVIRTRPFCEPGGSPIPPTDSPPTSPYASPPTPPPPPSPDAPQRRSSQQPGLRAEGTPGWPTSLLSCLRSLPPPSRLRSCRSSRTASKHETALHYTSPNTTYTSPLLLLRYPYLRYAPRCPLQWLLRPTRSGPAAMASLRSRAWPS